MGGLCVTVLAASGHALGAEGGCHVARANNTGGWGSARTPGIVVGPCARRRGQLPRRPRFRWG